MAEASPGATAKGRVAIITGGASGIGRAFAEQLALHGVEVVIADRQVDLAEEVAGAIRERGGRASIAELDVRDFRQFETLARETSARTGRIDFLFNNAGIGVGGEMRDYRLEDWDEVFDVNLRGVAYGVQAVYPLMIAQGFGHIVNTASMAGLIAGPMSGSYTTTKHAVVGLSKALRVEAKSYGVRVSVVCPGVIRTPILRGGRYGRVNLPVPEERSDEAVERLRPMDPQHFAKKVLRAVFRNQAIIVVPRWWKLFWYLERLSPTLGLHISERFLEAMRRYVREAQQQ
jgi:NAD(P)-dependent dehydrogenase (short-subunit alcohol dehydrogenase family)